MHMLLTQILIDDLARTVVDVVQRPESKGSFPGFYCQAEAQPNWISNSVALYPAQYYSKDVILRVDISSGQVEVLKIFNDGGSDSITDVGITDSHAYAVILHSTPITPNVPYLVKWSIDNLSNYELSEIVLPEVPYSEGRNDSFFFH
jgi:hypothetical protein